jgi:CRISPR-associated protein Csm4
MKLDLSNLDLRTDDELADLIRQGGNGVEAHGLQEARGLHAVLVRPHNTINRQTGTTGEGAFAPFAEKAVFYCHGTELAVFVLFEEEATDQERLAGAVANIGRFGFGRDASTGSGRFTVLSAALRNLPKAEDADACLALAPVIPAPGTCRDVMFTPFTRYGRHGDVLARSENPFKNPVIMADEGAVLVPEGRETFLKPYIGRAVRGISKSLPQAVVQGFAPYLPFKLES